MPDKTNSTKTGKILIILSTFVVLAASAAAQPRLVSHKVSLRNGKSFDLKLPTDFEIIPAAEGLARLRFFAKSPDGRIFVTDMYNLTDNKRGKIYILSEFDPVSGKFGKVTEYMSGLHNPNSVQFYADPRGGEWIYIAETGKLTRRRFTRGEEHPTDNAPETIATFPDDGLSYKYGGWHLTRTIAFGANGKLYVSVGSSCNSCIEKEEIRAAVIEMEPDGKNQRIFAKGLRNAVGMRWFGNNLFVTNQGSDHLGNAKPDETFYALREGADHGWPYCHSSNGRIIPDPKLQRPGRCRGVVVPYARFPARSSALGFDYFDDPEAPAAIRDAFLVALHGSTNIRTAKGYSVVIMRKGRQLQNMITGFLDGGTVNGRPCDIFKLSPDSFLLSDDHSGVVYLVRKKDSRPVIAPDPVRKVPEQPTVTPPPASEASAPCFAMLIFAIAAFFRSNLLI